MFRSAPGQSRLSLLLAGLVFLLSSGTQWAWAQDRTYNYILTRTYKSMLKDPAVPVSAGEANLSLSYMDGLGRLKQQVNVQAGKDNKDLVAPLEYNSLGQLINTYLPVRAESQNGSFQTAATTLATTYYNDNSRFSDPTSRVYSESRYEASPLSRPAAQLAAGTDKPVSVAYGINGNINVRRYKAGAALTDISQDGYYEAGQLTFVQTTDEEGAITSEYTDKQGQLILRRSGSGQLVTNTYYVYDDRDQLRAVLQPMFEVVPTPGATDLANFAFLYHYDGRGRLDQKQVPGGGITTLGYDTRDRLVSTLDAKGQRFYYHYDGLNRQTEMGICTGACDPLNPASTTNKSLLIHTYYDSYTVTTETGQTLSAEFPFSAGEATYSWAAASDFMPSDMATASRKGQVTGHCVRLLNADGSLGTLWSCDAVYYDDRYRPLQTVRRLPYMGSNGMERVSYKRDFIGKVTAQKTTQSWDSQSYTVEKLYSYDQAERLTATRMRTSSSGPNALPTQDIVINAQRYNEIGQLATKYLHAADTRGNQAMEQLTYKRNVRGWLREHQGIASSSRVFKLGLTYAGNGNIASQDIQTPTVGLATYAFNYDELNRLKSGHGEEPTYDLNGNIKTLKRTNSASTAIDNLSYDYSGNQLTKVTDGTNLSEGFDNGGSGSDTDYTYDANGNLTKDRNRGLGNQTQEGIFYNYLNLPRKVVGSKTVEYIYDATGQKRKSSVVNGTESTLYEGIFEYDGANLPTRIATDEGQLVKVDGNWQWQYYLQDHLGNVRVVLDQAGNAVQETDYYPFGLAQAKKPTDLVSSRTNNKYLYLNRELQPETGWLDLKARMYDPTVGRFMGVDPLTDLQEHLSPYHYSYNNPLRFSDPNGKMGDDCCSGFELAGAVLGTAKSLAISAVNMTAMIAHVPVRLRSGEGLGDVSAVEISPLDSPKQQVANIAHDILDGANVMSVAGSGGTGVGLLMAETGGKAAIVTASTKAGSRALEAASDGAVKAHIGPAGDASARVTKQMPANFVAKTTKKGDGTIFTDPENPKANIVRVQSGNPNSQNATQSRPYVREIRGGKVIDKSGKEVPNASAESHIPANEYKYRRGNQ